jgi:putative nucleotidyltransferase with HDIG domain
MNAISPNFPHIALLDRVKAAIPNDVPAYLVGGAVRDLLLNRHSHDLDFAVPTDAIKISRRVANTLRGAFFPLDEERDTGRVIYTKPDEGDRIVLDFAAYRGPDLESDLLDRDFTINAMAVPLEDMSRLIDPLSGAKDVYDKKMRACSSHAFSDDPVRIIRCVRQAVEFGFSITPETKTLLREALPDLPNVSSERLRDELFRIFEGPNPAAALRNLDTIGVLPQVLPELTTLKGITQPPPHSSDVWSHTLMTSEKLAKILDVLALEHDPESAANWEMGVVSLKLGRYRKQLHRHLNKVINPDRPLRTLLLFGALYHDSGKHRTYHTEGDGRIRFIEHEKVGAEIAGKRARILRLSNIEVERIQTTIRNHMRPLLLAQTEKMPSRRAIYRFFRDCGEAGVDVCLLALGDTLATYSPAIPSDIWTKQLDVVRTLLEAWWEKSAQVVSPPSFLGGNDLIQIFGMTPGPKIGQLLEAIRESQAAEELLNRQEALEFARQWLEDIRD